MPNGVTIPLQFEIYKGGELVRTETLTQDVIKVGKLSSSHLRIEDENVSRMHAVIEITSPTEISIIDLGSSKGTIVNGQKVNKGRLKSGDEILLGNTRLVLTVGEPVAAAAQATIVSAPAPVPSPLPAPVVPPPQYAPPLLAPLSLEAVEVRDGSQAIEVVALFENAILDTRHYTNPAAGDVQGSTKGILAGAAGSLFGAFVLFVVAWFQVDRLQQVREAWEKANPGKGTNEFPMPHEGPWMDIVVAVLLVSGLSLLIWGLLRLFEERQPRHFTIGPAADALVNVPANLVPTANFPLVRSTGSAYELLFTPAMQGDVTLAARVHTLQELVAQGRAPASSAVAGAHAFAIPEGARARVDLDQATFLVNSVAPPRRHPVPFKLDWDLLAPLVGCFVGGALFLGMIFSIPPDPKSLSLDAFLNDQRFAKFVIKPPEEKEEQIPEWLKKKGPDEAGGKGKRHKGEEGKMGKKTSKNKAGLYALKGPKDNTDPHLAKQLATEAAQKAGVLGILKANEGSHLASIFGRDSALGNDAENVLGGLVGTQVGEAYGVGGLGLVGSGRGGGGTGEGTIGLGNLGTIGKGGGGGSGSGYGRGAGGLGGRRAHAPDVVPGTAQVRGSLDKEIIRRIIRRHINEVKFCYEKELTKNQNLYGRVIIQFTIAGTGQVVASLVQQSTMNNPPVEQCIAGALRRWEFPKPNGGGIVIVSYPFVLKSAGGEE